MKKFLSLLLLVILFLGLSFPVEAAKKRIRVHATGTSYSSARLSRTTNSVVLTFLNLGKVTRVAYTLSYTANGVQQGVVGSFKPSGQTSDSRDLYFGTCSKGVCTPHYGIQNATLLVSTTLNSGAINVKRYRLKV